MQYLTVNVQAYIRDAKSESLDCNRQRFSFRLMYLAEHLPRLNSVIVSVDSSGDCSPSISYTPSSKILNVDGTAIELPILQSSEDANITIMNMKKNRETSNISILLKVPPVLQELSLTSFMNYSVPSLSTTLFVQRWSVQDLKRRTPAELTTNNNIFSFNCQNCSSVLVDSKHNKFFDMPSELWAEMMDFWHCHKPNIDLRSNQEKAYYNGILKPGQVNEVCIGNYYLLIRIDNLEGSLVNFYEDACSCKSCGHPVGNYLEEISVYDKEMYFKLNKWSLKLSCASFDEDYQPYLYAYNLIMDKVNSLALRKFIINGNLLVWVTNIGINVSVGQNIYRDALKVMTQEVAGGEPKEEDNVDSFEIPLEVFSSLVGRLNSIHEQLPIGNRQTKVKDEERGYVEYRVSYLPSL